MSYFSNYSVVNTINIGIFINRIKFKWLFPFFHLFAFLICTFLSYLVPKKKNSIVFFCNEIGLFGGNIKPIFLYALKNFKSSHINLLTFKDSTSDQVKKLGIKAIKYPSLFGVWRFLRAEKVVIECGLRIEICGLLMNSQVFQIWHGANLKYMVKELNTAENLKKLTIPERWVRLIKTNYPKYEFIVSPSEFYKKNTFSKSFSSKKVFVAGYPRNDLFFRDTIDADWLGVDRNIINKAKSHKKSGGKVVIYCPTWRDKALESEQANPFTSNFLNFLEENNIFLIVKKHHRDKRNICDKDHHLVSIYPHSKDIYLLMKYSDLLITDYSSIFFDYLLLNKPVVFFPYDYNTYVRRDRLFQYDYDEFTPGKKCYDDKELSEEILKTFNENDNYYKFERQRVKEIAFDKKPCYNSSEKIWQEIIKE